jgi:dTDP-4-amino-4,6-dideoxygalactose transaminase
MKIPFVDFPKSYQEIRKEVLAEIDRVLSAGDLILRADGEKFEKNLAKYCGAKYAVGLNSGTDALFLSLKVLGIGQGDEVITSGYTFWATVEAIINCGAKPVLADIERNSLVIDPKDIEKKITDKTKAIIPVHIGGAVCDMEKIIRIADKYHLDIVEDSAQAIGAIGLSGDTACYSFYPAKVLGGYGDGGAVVTNEKFLADKIKLLRNHGGKPHPKFVGYNSRLDNLQATILNLKLKYLDDLIKRRNEIAKIYDNIRELGRPISQTYQEYNLRVDERDELFDFLEENGIETIKGDYTFPIEVPENCKRANKEIIRLPIWPTLKDEEIKYVCEKIKQFYVSKRQGNNNL